MYNFNSIKVALVKLIKQDSSRSGGSLSDKVEHPSGGYTRKVVEDTSLTRGSYVEHIVIEPSPTITLDDMNLVRDDTKQNSVLPDWPEPCSYCLKRYNCTNLPDVCRARDKVEQMQNVTHETIRYDLDIMCDNFEFIDHNWPTHEVVINRGL